MPIVKCDYCGKEKELKDYDAKRSKTHFCDNYCKSKYQQKDNVINEYKDYAEMLISKHDTILKVLFDNEDIERIQNYKWIAKYDKTINNYYIHAWTREGRNRKRISIHRYITNCGKDLQVDHINRNTLDNRKDNLRVCTLQENLQNKGRYKNNKSGHKYICFHKPHNRYVVEIKINGKAKYIGSNKDLQKAIQIRDKFIKEVMPHATV